MKNIEPGHRSCGCSPTDHSRRDFIRLSLGSLALLGTRVALGDGSATGPSQATGKYYGIFSELPGQAESQEIGQRTTMTLVPYGSTYLRLTTLPVVKAAS